MVRSFWVRFHQMYRDKAFNTVAARSGRGRGRGLGRGRGGGSGGSGGGGGGSGGSGGVQQIVVGGRGSGGTDRQQVSGPSLDEGKGVASRSRELSTEERKAAQFVSTVQACGIEVVVFDMDCTLTSLHSGGSLPRDQLGHFQRSISPSALVTIPQLLAAGVRVAVATFSDDLYTTPGIFMSPRAASMQIAGRALAKAVLGCFLSPEQIAHIPLITLNPNLYSLQHKKVLESLFLGKISDLAESHGCSSAALTRELGSYPPPKDKTWHLHVVSELFGLPLAKLCLIDDSPNNVASALAMGCGGVEVREREGLQWEDLIFWCESIGKSRSRSNP